MIFPIPVTLLTPSGQSQEVILLEELQSFSVNPKLIWEDDASSDKTIDYYVYNTTLDFDTDHYKLNATGTGPTFVLTTTNIYPSINSTDVLRYTFDVRDGTQSSVEVKGRVNNNSTSNGNGTASIFTSPTWTTHVIEESNPATNNDYKYLGFKAFHTSGNIEFRNMKVEFVYTETLSNFPMYVDCSKFDDTFWNALSSGRDFAVKDSNGNYLHTKTLFRSINPRDAAIFFKPETYTLSSEENYTLYSYDSLPMSAQDVWDNYNLYSNFESTSSEKEKLYFDEDVYVTTPASSSFNQFGTDDFKVNFTIHIGGEFPYNNANAVVLANSENNANSLNNYWKIQIDDNEEPYSLTLTIRDPSGGTSYDIPPLSSVNDGNEHDVEFDFKRSTNEVDVYLDNILLYTIDTSARPGTLSNSYGIRVGNIGANQLQNTTVSNIKIYDNGGTLVGHWLGCGNENSDWEDQSGNGNDGTISGTSPNKIVYPDNNHKEPLIFYDTQLSIDPYIANSVSLSSSGAYIKTLKGGTVRGNNFTINALIKYNDTNTSNQYFLELGYPESNQNCSFGRESNFWGIRVGSGFDLFPDDTVNDLKWHMHNITYDGTNVRWYIDNQLKRTDSNPLNLTTTTAPHIFGSRYTSTDYSTTTKANIDLDLITVLGSVISRDAIIASNNMIFNNKYTVNVN